MQLQGSGWATVAPWDEDEVPPPTEVACIATGAGEDALMEAAAAARAKKKGKSK